MNFESFDFPHFGGGFCVCRVKKPMIGVTDIPKLKKAADSSLPTYTNRGPGPHILGISLTTTHVL
jgi:hypothetical protein